MPRPITIELNDDQAEILDALASGSGVDPAVLLLRAVGLGLSVMIADVEHVDEWEQPGPSNAAPGPSITSSGHKPDLDDGLPF